MSVEKEKGWRSIRHVRLRLKVCSDCQPSKMQRIFITLMLYMFTTCLYANVGAIYILIITEDGCILTRVGILPYIGPSYDHKAIIKYSYSCTNFAEDAKRASIHC